MDDFGNLCLWQKTKLLKLFERKTEARQMKSAEGSRTVKLSLTKVCHFFR